MGDGLKRAFAAANATQSQDWADKWARDMLKSYRRGSQIDASCREVYSVVATALRDAYAQGHMTRKPTKPKAQ